ncbi:MAG TPA: glycolate oxidase subunit GlcE [Burkholderiales bacterium]|nr:glycolate oxidase subunit GlcE [Burkholderiales bacterium]
MQEHIDRFAATIRAAVDAKAPLRIRGGGTKDFYGGELRGDLLGTTDYRGIVDYEPTELVITARCGTPLSEIEDAMREQGQMLAFEPPHFGDGATLGGCIAAGLSGPRRPYAGAARDFVLGVRMLDGKGSDLRFGGQVMKNVAGYDLSRLMAGSLGTLGVILEVSLKALPLPAAKVTLRREQTQAEAIALMNEWAGQPLPLSATCHMGTSLHVRLSGAPSAVRAARDKIGGEEAADGAAFWRSVREHEAAFFTLPQPLWRLSVKSTTPPLNIAGQQLIEWGGALRWLKSEADAKTVREAAAFGGGHATLFRGGDKSAGVFAPLPEAIEKIHRRLKRSFDPAGILNPARLYDWM